MEHVIAQLLREFEQGKMDRRQFIQSVAVTATAVSAGSTLSAAGPEAGGLLAQATVLNHVSHPVKDYAKSRDWYSGLFGLKTVLDDKKRKANLAVGESLLILKNRDVQEAPVDHICFTIKGWDEDKSVRPRIDADLQKRGIKIQRRSDTSIYINDPDDFSVQIGGKEQ